MATPHEIKLGKVRIGGPFGATTGLMVGSIFYDKHSIVEDAFAGSFNAERAHALLERVNRTGQTYAMQMALDVIAASPEAMDKFLRFVAMNTDYPMLINSSEGDVRVQGLKTAAELGVLDRCIYASLNEDTEPFELEALKAFRPGAVMILANDVGDPTPEGSVAMVRDYFQPLLAQIGQEAAIVDLGVMDPPSIGIVMRGVKAVREEFGWPVGGAMSNCFTQWTGLRDLGKEFVNLSLSSSLVACRAVGAEFLHYGLIEKVIPCTHGVASAEVFLGFAAQEVDQQQLPDRHPLYQMFKLGSATKAA